MLRVAKIYTGHLFLTQRCEIFIIICGIALLKSENAGKPLQRHKDNPKDSEDAKEFAKHKLFNFNNWRIFGRKTVIYAVLFILLLLRVQTSCLHITYFPEVWLLWLQQLLFFSMT